MHHPPETQMAIPVQPLSLNESTVYDDSQSQLDSIQSTKSGSQSKRRAGGLFLRRAHSVSSKTKDGDKPQHQEVDDHLPPLLVLPNLIEGPPLIPPIELSPTTFGTAEHFIGSLPLWNASADTLLDFKCDEHPDSGTLLFPPESNSKIHHSSETKVGNDESTATLFMAPAAEPETYFEVQGSPSLISEPSDPTSTTLEHQRKKSINALRRQAVYQPDFRKSSLAAENTHRCVDLLQYHELHEDATVRPDPSAQIPTDSDYDSDATSCGSELDSDTDSNVEVEVELDQDSAMGSLRGYDTWSEPGGIQRRRPSATDSAQGASTDRDIRTIDVSKKHSKQGIKSKPAVPPHERQIAFTRERRDLISSMAHMGEEDDDDEDQALGSVLLRSRGTVPSKMQHRFDSPLHSHAYTRPPFHRPNPTAPSPGPRFYSNPSASRSATHLHRSMGQSGYALPPMGSYPYQQPGRPTPSCFHPHNLPCSTSCGSYAPKPLLHYPRAGPNRTGGLYSHHSATLSSPGLAPPVAMRHQFPHGPLTSSSQYCFPPPMNPHICDHHYARLNGGSMHHAYSQLPYGYGSGPVADLGPLVEEMYLAPPGPAHSVSAESKKKKHSKSKSKSHSKKNPTGYCAIPLDTDFNDPHQKHEKRNHTKSETHSHREHKKREKSKPSKSKHPIEPVSEVV
jgi:hypothetical protein